MRNALVIATATVLAGLTTYQWVAYVLIAAALSISGFVLLRQLDHEVRISAIEADQKKRAEEQGQRLGDELRGD